MLKIRRYQIGSLLSLSLHCLSLPFFLLEGLVRSEQEIDVVARNSCNVEALEVKEGPPGNLKLGKIEDRRYAHKQN